MSRHLITILLLLQFASNVSGISQVDSMIRQCRISNEHDTDFAKCVDLKSFEISGVDPIAGIQLAKTALSVSKSSNWIKGIALANNELAVCYAVIGNFDSALIHYNLAYEHFKKLGNIVAQSAVLTNMSLVYKSKGDYLKALKMLDIALKIQTEKKMLLSKGITLENIGVIHLELGNYNLSRKYFKEAETIYILLKDSSGLNRNLTNLGILLEKTHAYDSAINCFETALDFNLKHNRISSVRQTYANLGIAYFHKKEFDKAIEMHKKAIQYGKMLRSEQSLAVDYGNIGEVYLERYKTFKKKTDLELSIFYLKEGFFTCQKLGFVTPQIEFGERLTEALDLNQSDFELAYKVHKIKTHIKDSIFSKDNTLKINELINMNEIARKETELRITRMENSINKAENKKYKLQKTVLILIVILSGLVILLLYMAYTNKDRIFRNKIYAISQFQAHQIRTPVVKILSIIDAIRKTENDETEMKNLLKLLEISTIELDERIHEIVEKHLNK